MKMIKIIMVTITMVMTIIMMITCTVAGRRLRAAAMERRGETARRAMADMICCNAIVRVVMRVMQMMMTMIMIADMMCWTMTSNKMVE